MNDLYKTYLMNWSPYDLKKTTIPGLDIKSSEYLYVCILDAVRNHRPFSVVRMGDGEAGFIRYSLKGAKPGWMNPVWCSKFGIKDTTDQNFRNIGMGLIQTANTTTFLGSSIWGSSHSLDSWDVEKYIQRPTTKPRCSNWFNMEWIANGCAHNLVT